MTLSYTDFITNCNRISILKNTTSYSQHIALIMGLFLLLPGTSPAQDNGDEAVHWAYAAFLGTGWYKLDSNRQVFVLRIPPRWYFRDSSIDESGKRQLGIEFHFPLTFGLHKLEQLDDFIDFDNIGTVSFNPGVEIEIPVSDRWRLRAYGHLGWGKETTSDESAWIYDAGFKSRYSFQSGNLDWAIVNEVFLAGYSETGAGSDSLTGMMAGLDFSYPITFGSSTRDALKLNWDVSYRWYENDPSFPRIASEPVSIEDEWELGLAIARRDGPIKIWFLKFEHLGLSYRFNSDGSFRAITVNFHAPFTR